MIRSIASSLSKVPSYVVDILILIVLCMVAGTQIFRAGKLGFHWHDLSIVFDAGYRLTIGQKPFVDFFSPFGPTLFIQQAIFNKVFGVNINSYLFHAFFLNSIAIFISYKLIKRYGRVEALIAASVTAVWFFLPPGAPYIDTTAFFWTLIGFALMYCYIDREPDRIWLLCLAGMAIGLSILTKQNIGLFSAIILLLALLILTRNRKRAFFGYVVGISIQLSVFILFLFLQEAQNDFVHYWYVLPAGENRLESVFPHTIRRVLNTLKVGKVWGVNSHDWLSEIYLLAISSYLVAILLANYRKKKGNIAVLALSLILLQHLSRHTSNNNWPLYLVYAGIILVSLAIILINPVRTRRIVLLGVSIPMILLGYHVSITRAAHFGKLDVPYSIDVPQLSGLRVSEIEGPEFRELILYLQKEMPDQNPLYVTGFKTIIYGITGATPVNPLLFPMPWTDPNNDQYRTDYKALSQLQSNPDVWVITGDNSFELGDLPALNDYFINEFEVVEDIGNSYDVWRKKHE